MSATKYTAAIEIGTGSVKYLAGYARGGRPVPVHKAERPLPCPFHPGKNTEEETKAISESIESQTVDFLVQALLPADTDAAA